MNKALRLTVFLAFAALGACAGPGAGLGVTVRDEHFEVVKMLGPEEVAAFARQWEAKAEVQVPLRGEGGVHFKLDIDQSNRSSRWLYYTSGLVTRLDYKLRPVYRVSDVAAFNHLIGAKQ